MKILSRLANLFSYKNITADTDNSDIYLTRYYLLRTTYFAIYIHKIYRSDADRHCHTHPWNFISIILSGSYLEHTPSRIIPRYRFLPAYRPFTFAHRVQLISKAVTTLIFRLGKSKDNWYFITENGNIPWKDYVFNTPNEFKKVSNA